MARKALPVARVRQVRAAFEAGLAPNTDLAKRLGISITTFRKLVRDKGWMRPAKRPTVKPKARVPPPLSLEVPTTPFDTAALAARVESALTREIASVERMLAQPGAELVERDARILTNLVKALVELRRLETETVAKPRKGGHAGPERPPRDMAALRADLMAKLERLQRSRSGSNPAEGVDEG